MCKELPHDRLCNEIITFSNGYLGSYDDEERSEMRYVMRIAEFVNHQIFERTWRLLEACLFQCHTLSRPPRALWCMSLTESLLTPRGLKCGLGDPALHATSVPSGGERTTARCGRFQQWKQHPRDLYSLTLHQTEGTHKGGTVKCQMGPSRGVCPKHTPRRERRNPVPLRSPPLNL